MPQQIVETEIDIAHEHYGRIVARGVPADEFMRRYAADFNEWIEGTVIDVSPVTLLHDQLVGYLRELLRAFFAFNPIGTVAGAPFVLHLTVTDTRREPDLQVTLHANPGQLTNTAMIGAADICIEIVSEESVARDYGVKFAEYEKNGVREYWLLDPLRAASYFYRLNDAGLYVQQPLDADGNYRTPLLPQFVLHVPTLWQEQLPDIATVVRSVQAMLTNPAE